MMRKRKSLKMAGRRMSGAVFSSSSSSVTAARNQLLVDSAFTCQAIVWYGIAWSGLIWYGMALCGLVWYGWVPSANQLSVRR